MMRNIVAILRGVEPEEVVEIGAALLAAGIEIIEVPLNSPRPFESVARLVEAFGDRALIGAGTVLSVEEAERLAEIGARLVVSPHCDPAVIARSVALGMTCMPGVFTPTECFQALRAGARSLKLFPAEVAGPKGLRALKAVLPKDVQVFAVGGAKAETLVEWLEAGADGFGIGGALYQPGMTAEAVRARADALVAAYDAAAPGRPAKEKAE